MPTRGLILLSLRHDKWQKSSNTKYFYLFTSKLTINTMHWHKHTKAVEHCYGTNEVQPTKTKKWYQNTNCHNACAHCIL